MPDHKTDGLIDLNAKPQRIRGQASNNQVLVSLLILEFFIFFVSSAIYVFLLGWVITYEVDF